MINLYCKENSKCQGKGNRPVHRKKFLYQKGTKEFFNTGQTDLTDSNFWKRKQFWEDDIPKLKKAYNLYFFCKNIPLFTGLACWEQAEGSTAGKVLWSPGKVYRKGHRYSLEALQLSQHLLTQHQCENFNIHLSRGHLGWESNGIREEEMFSPPILSCWTT